MKYQIIRKEQKDIVYNKHKKIFELTCINLEKFGSHQYFIKYINT